MQFSVFLNEFCSIHTHDKVENKLGKSDLYYFMESDLYYFMQENGSYKYFLVLAGVAQWTERWLPQTKGCRFDSQSGHMAGLWAKSQLGECGRQPHVDISFLLFLPPFPLSLKN